MSACQHSWKLIRRLGLGLARPGLVWSGLAWSGVAWSGQPLALPRAAQASSTRPPLQPTLPFTLAPHCHPPLPHPASTPPHPIPPKPTSVLSPPPSNPHLYFTPRYRFRLTQAHRLLGPSLRLVMLVREPLHRAASHYLYFQNNRRRFRRDANLSEALSHGLAEFERCAEQLRGWRHQCTYRDGRRAVERTSALLEGRHPEMWRLRHGKASFELIQAGLYSEHIATWEATFEPRQLLVMDAEDLIVRPLRVLRRVERHLKLPCAKYSLSTEHALASVTGNTTRSPGRAASEALAGISLALQQQLQRFFEPFNARLRERTGIQWGDQSTPQAPNSSTIQ